MDIYIKAHEKGKRDIEARLNRGSNQAPLVGWHLKGLYARFLLLIFQIYRVPVDNFGTVVGENPDCLLLSGTVVGENPDHVCWGPSHQKSHGFVLLVYLHLAEVFRYSKSPVHDVYEHGEQSHGTFGVTDSV